MPLGDPALDAAVRYFGTHGLRSTVLDDLARSGDLDVRELNRRYPSSRCLALGVFERMLELQSEQLEEQSKRGAPLSERLQRWFELELQLLEPCKALARGWLLDSMNPFSPAGWLQAPLAFRYAARIQRELELARERGEISGWTLPGVAAGAFVSLRRSLVLGWLGGDSTTARTLTLARAEIAAFVRLLAPWPGFEDARPALAQTRRAQQPRALPAAAESATPSSPELVLPVAAAVVPNEPESAAEVPAEAVPAEAVEVAIAQAPAVLGALAQPEPAAEPAPVAAPSEKAGARSKRRSRTKRGKH